LRVAVVGPVYPYRGGIAHYTAMLARALSRKHEVQVISFRRQYPAWLYPGRSDTDPSREPLQVQADYWLDPLDPLTWWQTGARLARSRPDAVVIQWWVTFWAPAYAAVAALCRRKRVPVVCLVHNVFPHEPRVWDVPLARLALRQGRSFIVHTEAERARLQSVIPGASVVVCPFPIYDMLAEKRLPGEVARQRLGLPQAGPVILAFGIVRPYKGLEVLLQAVALLRDRGRPVFLLVAGEFWHDKRRYETLIDQLELAEHVRLDDRYIPNEEVALYFSAADGFAAAYAAGTQSAAVATGLAFQVPVVTTEKLAAAVDPAHRRSLFIVPVNDASALAGAIEALLARPKAAAIDSNPPANGWDNLVRAIEAVRSN
jgi:glycosyltransferase involved in cell wall biosynthesis